MAKDSERTTLIINPNTTQPMTDALRPLVDKLGFGQVSSQSHEYIAMAS